MCDVALPLTNTTHLLGGGAAVPGADSEADAAVRDEAVKVGAFAQKSFKRGCGFAAMNEAIAQPNCMLEGEPEQAVGETSLGRKHFHGLRDGADESLGDAVQLLGSVGGGGHEALALVTGPAAARLRDAFATAVTNQFDHVVAGAEEHHSAVASTSTSNLSLGAHEDACRESCCAVDEETETYEGATREPHALEVGVGAGARARGAGTAWIDAAAPFGLAVTSALGTMGDVERSREDAKAVHGRNGPTDGGFPGMAEPPMDAADGMWLVDRPDGVHETGRHGGDGRVEPRRAKVACLGIRTRVGSRALDAQEVEPVARVHFSNIASDP